MFLFIKSICKVVPVHAVRIYGGVELWLHTFLFFELDGGEWWVSCNGSFIPGERASNIHWIWSCTRFIVRTLRKRENSLVPAGNLTTIFLFFQLTAYFSNILNRNIAVSSKKKILGGGEHLYWDFLSGSRYPKVWETLFYLILPFSAPTNEQRTLTVRRQKSYWQLLIPQI